MSRAGLPEGYVPVRQRGIDAFAWEPAAPWLVEVLDRHASLATWAASHTVGTLAGRGPVRVVPAHAAGPGGSAGWAVRHYRRGGWAAALLGDRYLALGPPRPHREVHASALARARGVRTPAVVAGAAYAAAGVFYRADLVTELVPAARPLSDVVVAADQAEATRALRHAGRLIAGLARAGVAHADLHVGNVLIDAAGEEWVLDLDRARVSPQGGVAAGPRMLARLERSLRKLARRSGRAITTTELRALRDGFAEEV